VKANPEGRHAPAKKLGLETSICIAKAAKPHSQEQPEFRQPQRIQQINRAYSNEVRCLVEHHQVAKGAVIVGEGSPEAPSQLQRRNRPYGVETK